MNNYHNLMRIAMLVNFVLAIVFIGCEDFFVFDFSEQGNNNDKSGSLEELFSNGKLGKSKLGIPQLRVSQGEYGDKIVVAWKMVKNAQYYRVLRRKKPAGTAFTPFIPIKEIVPKEVTSYEDTFNVNTMEIGDLYALYQYKVEALTYAGAKSTSFHSQDAYLLMPPRILRATKSLPTITVTWEDIRGASRYQIYRSNDQNSRGTLLPYVFGKALRRFIDTDESLEFGKRYYYYIVAVGSSGNTSKRVSAQSPAVGLRVRADAPKPPEVRASKAEFVSKIKITWDPVSPAKKNNFIVYNIFRRSDKSSREITVATEIQETSYDDRNSLEENVEYYYSVQPIEKSHIGAGKLIGGYNADISSDMSEKPQTGYLLSSPKTVRARRVESSNDVEITWDVSRKATGYQVYVSKSAEGVYKIIAKLKNAHTYIDSGAVSRTESLFYKVLAVRDDTNPYLVTRLIEAKPIEPLPSVPQNVQASRNMYYDENLYRNWSRAIYPIKITWDQAWGANAYTLWRSDSENGIYSIIQNEIKSTKTYDESTDMEVEKYYYYKVSAQNSMGAFSDASTVNHGYGALSNKELVSLLNGTIKSSHRKLTLMHKLGTGPVGSETINGSVSGSVRYEAKLNVGSGRAEAVNIYKNYADTNALRIINGTNTTNVSIYSNGRQSLKYTIGGMYGRPNSAVITGNLTIAAGLAIAGYYDVTQNNGVPNSRVNK